MSLEGLGMDNLKTNIASVADVADAMLRDYNPNTSRQRLGRTIFLLGAGCSVSAGIPLAKDIAKELVCRLAADYCTIDIKNPDAEEAIRSLVKHKKFRETTIENQNVDWNAVYD